MVRVSALGALLLALMTVACGPAGKAGKLVRPDEIDHPERLKNKCIDTSHDSRPLVIHWNESERTDLEAALKQNRIAVVAWSCDPETGGTMRVLRDCNLEGNYAYTGVQTKERVEELVDEDEIAANMPAGGLAFAAKIGADIRAGASLNIGMITVGQNRTTRVAATPEDLGGECTGATHFIRGWTVGAFAVAKGQKGKVSSVAQMFGAGVSAGSSSKRSTGIKDGDRGACQKASPTAEAPPGQCGAPLRIELRAVATKTQKLDLGKVARNQCPDGFVWTGEKCARRTSGPFECPDYDAAQCKAQCEKSNAASCRKLAVMYDTGEGGVTKDRRLAYDFANRACDSKDQPGCSLKKWLQVVRKGAKPTKAEYQAAAAMWERNCFAGDNLGCHFMGKAYANGWGTDRNPARAATYYERACKGGYEAGCNNLATHYYHGRGVGKDFGKARTMFKKSCVAGNHVACDNLAYMFEHGKGSKKGKPDVEAGVKYYTKGCELGNGTSCYRLGRLFMTGYKSATYTHPKDKKRGVKLLMRGCKLDNSPACYKAANLFAKDFSIPRDLMRAGRLYEKGCSLDHAGACYELAEMQRHGKGGQEKLAPLQLAGTYEKSCDKGLGRACRVLGEFYEKGTIATDKKKAAEYYRRGCRARYRDGVSCSAYDAIRYGQQASRGSLASLISLKWKCTSRRNPSRAACAALTKGSKGTISKCERTKDKLACYAAGYVTRFGYGIPKDGEKAADYYEKACEAGHQRACESAGDMYYSGKSGAPKKRFKATALYRKGNKLQQDICKKKGDMNACASLGRNLMVGKGGIKNPFKGAKLLGDACDSGLARVCVELGRYYYLGKRIGKDRSKGFKLMQRGCRSKSGKYSCSSVARNMVEGRYGFAPEKSRGLLLFGLACQNGYSYACRQKRKYSGSR